MPVRNDYNGCRSAEYARVSGAIGAVTRAGCGLEAASIEYGDLASAVLNQPELLQRPGRAGHAHAAHAQHQREELLGDVEHSSACTRSCVMSSQRASRASTTWYRVQPAVCASSLKCTKAYRSIDAMQRLVAFESRRGTPPHPCAAPDPRPAPLRAPTTRPRRAPAEFRTCLHFRSIPPRDPQSL